MSAAVSGVHAAFQYSGQVKSTGKFTLHGPTGAAVDRFGDLFVADTAAHRIVKFASNGDRKAFGSFGSGRGQLSYPTGVAVYDDNGSTVVYVADWGNSRIVMFSKDGHYMKTFGSLGSGDGELDHPLGLVSDPGTGDLYVTEERNYRVSVFKQGGKWIRSFSCSACPEGPYHRLGGGIALKPTVGGGASEVLASDQFYSSQYGRVLVTDTKGNWVVTFGSNSGANQIGFPDGVAYDPADDTTWVVDSSNQGTFTLLRFGPTGEVLTSYSGVANRDQFGSPHGVVLDVQRRELGFPAILYVVSTGNSQIYTYDQVPGDILAATYPRKEWHEQAVFALSYNGFEQICTNQTASAEITVDPTDPNPFKFTIDGDGAGAVTDVGGKLTMAMTLLQDVKIHHAWRNGKQIRIVLDAPVECPDGSKYTDKHTLFL